MTLRLVHVLSAVLVLTATLVVVASPARPVRPGPLHVPPTTPGTWTATVPAPAVTR